LKRARNQDEHDNAVAVIETETQRLIRLTDNVLAAVRTTRPRLAAGPIDVSEVVASSAQLCEQLAEARSMRIEIDAVSAIAAGDAGALKQVLVNLIDNAVKYGPNGQTIRIGVRTEAQDIQIWVEDSGPGIPLKDRERVWEAFTRLESPGDATAGTGIGLTIARELILQMHGRVEIQQSAGTGARISVFLPRWTAEQSE
jgi:signal transduction histidine kinase